MENCVEGWIDESMSSIDVGEMRSPQAANRRPATTQPCSSGSGFGSSTLRQRNSNRQYQQRNPSFGSGGARRSAPRARRR